jgi:hypothetical protein
MYGGPPVGKGCFENGWWAGWVARGEQRLALALSMDMASAAEAPKRIASGKRLSVRAPRGLMQAADLASFPTEAR